MTIVHNDPAQDWIQVYQGKVFDFVNPTEQMIDIENIAHSLSMLCRFGGHCKWFYSVAQHCCYAYDAAKPENKKEALLHDASEAYIQDIVRPLKRRLPDYNVYESNIERLIAKKFNLPYPMSKEVKYIDNQLCNTEKLQIMHPCSKAWIPLPSPLHIRIFFWSPNRARDEFMDRWEKVK